MRNFFIGLLILSLLAVGGTYYWRTYLPEKVAPQELTMGGTRSVAASRDKSNPSLSAGPQEKAPSDRQDWAMIISIASSIISALGAMAQVWLQARR